MTTGGTRIKMKILRGGTPEDVEDEAEHLIVVPKNRFRNPWRTSLRVIMVLLLFASVGTVMLLIIKEWYLLAHQAHIDLNYWNLTAAENDVCRIRSSFRFDCFPTGGANQEECIKRNCCWNPRTEQPGEPYCYFSNGFTYYEWSTPIQTKFGLQAVITLKTLSSPYPNDVKQLLVNVYYETDSTVRIKIFDNATSRFEIPLEYTETTQKAENITYSVKFYPTGFQIYRNGLDFPLFDSTIAPLIYSNQFLQISSLLPSEYVYGIGEVEDTLKRDINWSRSVLWTHDTVPRKHTNLYGSHPFYMVMERSGSSHGVFLANSNAMEVLLQPAPAVTFRTIGGIIDLRVFIGPTPPDVMNQYTKTIKRPFLPPYWSLGFHLCRFNYGTLNHTEEILENNLKAGIPVDVQWNDLDYMQNQNDFTFDKVKFNKLPEFVKKLHERGMHYIPLVDPGISAGEIPGDYSPYDLGIQQNVFIKDGLTYMPFVGKVWNPTATVWPDFTHPNISHYWLTVFDKFHSTVEFDGAWIDMNEPSNFWDGTKDGNCIINSTLDHPPYVPNVEGEKLFTKTICPSARQYGGRHYDLHNLYGTLETIVTSKVLGDIRSERQFIISRSTFPGQGHYGGHWTGDVVSNWEHMKKSVPQILNFGLFGIPMVGADICGFNGNTTVELCKRWHQLGAFYPFSRNHNTDDGIPQDPASLGAEVIAAAKETLQLRYSLLPYIYTLFFHSHITGEPVARPMFYEFPEDRNTFLIESTFMLGTSVLIIPILDEAHQGSTVKAYLPKGWWYSHYNLDIIGSLGEEVDVVIPEEFHSIPVFYRAGTIVIRQEPAANTMLSRKNPFSIHAYLSSDSGSAKGELYWDDGITPNPDIVGGYNHYLLKVSSQSLTVDADYESYIGANLTLAFMEIRGIKGSVSAVVINNVPWDTFTFNQKMRTLYVNTTKQAVSFTDGLTLNWIA